MRAHHTVDLVIFACLNLREFLILGLFTKFRIREFFFFFSSAIYYNNNFREILEFANLSSSRKLKLREYYQIYSILIFQHIFYHTHKLYYTSVYYKFEQRL